MGLRAASWSVDGDDGARRREAEAGPEKRRRRRKEKEKEKEGFGRVTTVRPNSTQTNPKHKHFCTTQHPPTSSRAFTYPGFQQTPKTQNPRIYLFRDGAKSERERRVEKRRLLGKDGEEDTSRGEERKRAAGDGEQCERGEVEEDGA
ncbi:hypothetical protein Droror1_Dr00008533 [Drosera rotundifolia]